MKSFCKKYEVLDKDCAPLTAQVVKHLKAQSASAGGATSPIDFETKVDVKSKSGKPSRKETLKVTKGAAIEPVVQTFCKTHEIADKECSTLSGQVVKYLATQSPSSAVPAAAPAAATAGTASPIDFKTDIDVKSKSGAGSKKQPFSIKAGQSIESMVDSFCGTHEVKPADCGPLKKSIVSYLVKQKPAAGGAAPAAAAPAGAGTASPIDFETKVDVKSKTGGPTKKQQLKIAKGASIESSVQAFCNQHEVKSADCTPLIGQVVSYLKTKGSAPGAAAPSAAAGGSGTPSPIDFETMVNVKSKSSGAQSKQNMKITKGEAIEGAVSKFCAKHDVTDSVSASSVLSHHAKALLLNKQLTILPALPTQLRYQCGDLTLFVQDCAPLTAQVVKYLASRK